MVDRLSIALLNIDIQYRRMVEDPAELAACAPDGAIIHEPPVGHAPWKETALRGPGECAARSHTVSLRSKHFMDRVGMEALLRR